MKIFKVNYMYKYTSKYVADLLFQKNIIRIGTLKGFREMEEKQGISDPLEGSYRDIFQTSNVNEKNYFSNPRLRENIKHAISIGPNSSNIHIGSVEIRTHRQSPNYLIYCIAHTKSKDLLDEFEGAEICYQINKPDTFYQLITWALEKKLNCEVEFLGVHEVSYDEYERKRSDENSLPIPPALTKTSHFSRQCELRAIWKAPEEFINDPFYDLNIIGLKKTCSIADL